MFQQGKRKTKCLLDVYTKKTKVFLRTLCAFSILAYSLARSDFTDWNVRQPVQPHTFYAQLLVSDMTSAQPHFAVANCSDVVMSMFYFPVLTRSLICLQL